MFFVLSSNLSVVRTLDSWDVVIKDHIEIHWSSDSPQVVGLASHSVFLIESLSEIVLVPWQFYFSGTGSRCEK